VARRVTSLISSTDKLVRSADQQKIFMQKKLTTTGELVAYASALAGLLGGWLYVSRSQRFGT